MTTVDVERAVALVTGEREPETDEERAKLKRGDALVAAVTRHGVTLHGNPIVDKWPGREPPDFHAREGLSAAQRVTGALVLRGFTSTQIAAELKVSTETVRHNMKAIREKTGESKTWRAAFVALVRGWL